MVKRIKDEFKNFVDKTIEERFYDYEEEGERENLIIDYELLYNLSYNNFIKGYHKTAKEDIIEEVFYN